MFAAVDDAKSILIWNSVFVKNSKPKKFYNKIRISITSIKISPQCKFIIIGAIKRLLIKSNGFLLEP